jgi:very-short-patch-repair endonuclease
MHGRKELSVDRTTIWPMRQKLVLATEALASGAVTRRELARDYSKLFRNVYVRNGEKLTAKDKAIAAWFWSGRSATLGGLSAAAVLGSRYVDASAPAELIRANRRAPEGIVIHSDSVSDVDISRLGVLSATNPSRTAFDIGRRMDLVDAVIQIDALLNATGCSVDDVLAVARRNPGARGLRRALMALNVADAGAESPPETTTRLLLIAAGLPRPETQIPVEHGTYRLDMGWRGPLVAVEYDGQQHWTDPVQRARDIERLEFLASLGWTIIRVSWTQLRDQPQVVVNRVARALKLAPSVQVSHASLARCVQQLHTRRPESAGQYV